MNLHAHVQLFSTPPFKQRVAHGLCALLHDKERLQVLGQKPIAVEAQTVAEHPTGSGVADRIKLQRKFSQNLPV